MANIVIKRSKIDHYLFRSGGNIFIGVGSLTGVMVRGFGIGTGESGTGHSGKIEIFVQKSCKRNWARVIRK